MVVHCFIGLMLSLIYPKLVKGKIKKWSIFLIITLFIIVLLLTGELTTCIFLVMWSLVGLSLARKYIVDDVEDWKLSISLFLFFVATVVHFLLKFLPFILPITLILIILWISKEKSWDTYFKNIKFLFVGNMFMQVIAFMLTLSTIKFLNGN